MPNNCSRPGKVDAILVPRVPQSYVEGRSKMRRLFKDTQGEMQGYFRRTGILPITHTVVIRKSLSEQEPWVCESLVRAFMDAQTALRSGLPVRSEARVHRPTRSSIRRTIGRSMALNSWAHGVAPNRQNIETFVRYAHEQGYTARRLSVEELFPRNTLSL